MIKARDTLVRMKFSLINTIRDLLRSGGTNISELTPENLSKEGAKVLPVELRDTQNGLLTQLFHIREEIRNNNCIIAKLSKKYPAMQKLRSK